MSWYNDSFASADAGTGLADIWDACVVLNPHWSCYDAAAAANSKVYRCHDADENVDFYVLVKDNQSGYWDIELWEGWNAGTHAGVGRSIAVSSSTFAFRARRPNGGAWFLSVLDHRVVYIDAANWQGQYVGAPRRFDRSKNIVLICSGSTGTSYFNGLAYWTDAATGASRFLFNENKEAPVLRGDGGAVSSSYRLIMDVNGQLHIAGELMITGETTLLAVGTLEGVADLGAGATLNFSPAAGEIISIDGEDWILFSGTYSTKFWCAVRMA